MSLATMEEAHKVIQSIRFTLLSPSELRKLSAVEVQAADTYDEDGVPIVSGLMDGRLGTLEPRQKCKTCGNTASACPGHFGHIELAEPVIHVSFAKLIHRLLSITKTQRRPNSVPTAGKNSTRSNMESPPLSTRLWPREARCD